MFQSIDPRWRPSVNRLYRKRSGVAMSSGRGSLSTSVSSTLSSSLSSCLDEDLPSLMKSSLPSKFSALVTMHLSFMLDLSGTGLSELIDDRQQSVTDPPPSTTAAENRAKIISSVLFARKKHTKGNASVTILSAESLIENAYSG
jgi:hypothetical protein